MTSSYLSQSIMIFIASKAAFKSYTYKNRTLRWSTLGSFHSTQHKERKKYVFLMTLAWSIMAPQRWGPCRWHSLGERAVEGHWLHWLDVGRQNNWGILFLSWCHCKMHSSCNVCWLTDGWHVTPSAPKDNQNNRLFPFSFQSLSKSTQVTLKTQIPAQCSPCPA